MNKLNFTGPYIGPYPNLVVKRFWSRVKKGKKDECWEWIEEKGCHEFGYGNFYPSGLFGHCVGRGTHRVVLEMKLKRILRTEEQALHHCDNPKCCNPKHIYLGSHQDNMDDRRERGRTSKGKEHSKIIRQSKGIIAQRGEGNHQSKLTAEIVTEARKLFNEGRATIAGLAKTNKVDWRTMDSAVRGETWQYI